MTREEVSDIVRTRIGSLLDAPADFAETDSLARHGLDSLSSVELTLLLEDSFSIVFEDDELTFDNFGSVGSIVTMVHSKVGA
ncbi:acyl carrier protein [Streptomyces sp. GbtcB6]|uniref:acyl carrier protein n=1 Tax=Streptomyces sp. GbtcB6 TaxID=2824751 RepID=UPI001C309F2E|nr:phosphopantetheine-binding protein [Streptomyces sp. GbtcB6]